MYDLFYCHVKLKILNVTNCKTCPATAGFLMYRIADTICDHQDNTVAFKKLSAEKRTEIKNIWDKFENSDTCEKSCL